MQTRVWLMRHAETATPHIFHGAESDIGLSQLGEIQAVTAAAVYARLKPDVLISSGMLRARLTAQPIAVACGLPHAIEPELHERRVGELSGTLHDHQTGLWPDTLRRWMEGEIGYAPPASESFEAIRTRVVPIWDRLTQQYDGQSIVIVAHGIVCRVLLLSLIEGWSVKDWLKLGRIPNMAVSELVRRGNHWDAVTFNQVFPEVAAITPFAGSM